jgi:microcystin-dependent protein
VGQPYIGEIRIFAGNFAPAGWAFCDGQLLPISENDALFTLIGTTYGGDGQETFALPDLQSRIPVHRGSSFPIGAAAGVEEISLTIQQTPLHSHSFQGSSNNVTSTNPSNQVPATIPTFGVRAYGTDAPKTTLHPSAVTPVGGSQPHTNFQPYLCVNFIISLFGVFPTQT